MLLDQKKTRRMVVIVSIISAVAFVGVLPVVLGLVVFGDSGQDSAVNQLIDEAKAKVDANPNDVRALVDLAAQYRAANRLEDATATITKAVTITPKDNDELTALVGALFEQPGTQLQVLKDYTTKNPKDGLAFYTYGTTAETIGQVVTARLAYQKALQLSKPGSAERDNAQAALDRLKDTPAAPTPVVPSTTPTAPATPATPATP